MFVGLFITALAACQPKLTPEEDCNFVMSSQIQRVSWKGQLPINMHISRGVPTHLRESIRVAAAQWNYKLNKTLFVILDQNIENNYSKNSDGINGIYWITNWQYRAEEQAQTTIHWRGDRIKEADIIINAANHDFAPFGSLEPNKVDMTSLMVHELGHVLGLQHTSTPPSVMVETLPLLVNTTEPTQPGLRQDPAQVDINSLNCEY